MTTTPNEEVVIPEYDPQDLMAAQAIFGQAISTKPEILRIINAYGPALFAAVLFTMREDYQVDPSDPDALTPAKGILEAESAAIGVIRGVAQAMGRLADELSVVPTDSEVDADTDINPV